MGPYGGSSFTFSRWVSKRRIESQVLHVRYSSSGLGKLARALGKESDVLGPFLQYAWLLIASMWSWSFPQRMTPIWDCKQLDLEHRSPALERKAGGIQKGKEHKQDFQEHSQFQLSRRSLWGRSTLVSFSRSIPVELQWTQSTVLYHSDPEEVKDKSNMTKRKLKFEESGAKHVWNEASKRSDGTELKRKKSLSWLAHELRPSWIKRL